mmetsp:Transcript_6781/g.9369  ORF Transcript_6781/g.9369 Transcript_6781/m.9369 type:complete len:316 (-) Transcript_6781:22-969(-)
MTLRDRTNEFSGIVEHIRSKKASSGNKVAVTPPSTIRGKDSRLHPRTEFAIIAAQIGKDIAETTGNLEKLAKLAKKTSLFDDPTFEIQELTTVINQDIKNINSQISYLQEAQKKNNARKTKQAENHCQTVVKSLKGKLKSTTEDFSHVLELRTENLKQQQKERETFTGSYSLGALAKSRHESPLYRTATSYTNDVNTGAQTGEVAIPMPAMSTQQQALIAQQDRYIASRTEAVQHIESILVELGTIFQTVSRLVSEQGELIDRIDTNIEDTAENVKTAQSELLKYLATVSSNRWLFAKVFLVLIIFVVVFIVFFV